MQPGEAKMFSKLLSLILRHRPELMELTLDEGGWAEVEELVTKIRLRYPDFDRTVLRKIVEHNDKQRFAFSEDGTKIRANQGHSVPVNLGLVRRQPPATLFHGTATRHIESIRTRGLVRGSRHHVHLSDNEATARQVGARYGRPVVLTIDAQRMHTEGEEFYQSENGVWLTRAVEPRYIDFP